MNLYDIFIIHFQEKKLRNISKLKPPIGNIVGILEVFKLE